MKILVSDFDKTLFTDEYELNIELVNKFISEGNIFIIATGRPIYLLKPDMEKHNINYHYLICNDGAVIFDKEDKKIYEDNINNEDGKKIFYELQNDLNLEKVFIDTTSDFSIDTNDTFNGIVALPIDRKKAYGTIDYLCNKYPSIQGYLSHKWINILTKNASKGHAIKLLADINHWNTNEIITVGDNKNDLSMSHDFNSYAIKGDEELMRNAKHTATDFKEMMEKI
jgi:HAD superfamily hydrolase (TIGR01484 family)